MYTLKLVLDNRNGPLVPLRLYNPSLPVIQLRRSGLQLQRYSPHLKTSMYHKSV